jgi:hypothetical protein
MELLKKSFVPIFHPGFWFKMTLHLFMPGGFGCIRKLQDASNVHERDKQEVRKEHPGEVGWKSEKDGSVMKRDYASHEEYVTHQPQKLDEMLKMKGGFSNWDICEFRLKFYSCFKHPLGLFPKEATIDCWGDRQCTLVEVILGPGYRNAYGIDRNPCADNRIVREGEFHEACRPY